MEQIIKILLVEDSEIDEALLVRFLKKEKVLFNHIRVWKREEYIKALDIYNPDLIISDHSLPHFSGTEAFQILKKSKKITPFILITGTVSEKTLTDYVKQGMDDYILKYNLLRLPAAIQNVVDKRKIEKLHNELLSANEKLENAYLDIKASINYASYIQQAILPSHEELQKACNDYFVFYKPKDVVSGDFYWCTTTITTHTKRLVGIIAVVDCTGHGVPGAFMSMLANTLLNQTIKDPNINSPADVLDFLNKELPKNLKSYKNGGFLRDGLDISLCTIDMESKELCFSGANNACIIIKNDKLIELKADKQAISASTDKEKTPFTNQHISLEKGDIVYLYTDGYADQFGGPNKKKFMRQNFKKLLTYIHKNNLSTQKEIIEQHFDEWKGKLDQIDDVLVMGIKF